MQARWTGWLFTPTGFGRDMLVLLSHGPVTPAAAIGCEISAPDTIVVLMVPPVIIGVLGPIPPRALLMQSRNGCPALTPVVFGVWLNSLIPILPSGAQAMLGDHARSLWSRTGWARLGRIAAALERIEQRRPEQPPAARATPAESPGIGIRQRMGLALLLDPASDVDRWMIENGTWEPEQISKLMALAAEVTSKSSGPRVFLDIGAYFGLYALLADRTRTFERIIAFEPDRLNFAQLQAQLFLNGAAYRIESMNVAAGSAAGEMQMSRADLHEAGNRAGAGLWPSSGPDPRCVPTRIIAIDDLNLSGGVVVAKIDVEGYQDEVLRGMRKTIDRNACVFQIEALEGQRAATLRLLAQLGVKIEDQIGHDFYATSRLP